MGDTSGLQPASSADPSAAHGELDVRPVEAQPGAHPVNPTLSAVRPASLPNLQVISLKAANSSTYTGSAVRHVRYKTWQDWSNGMQPMSCFGFEEYVSSQSRPGCRPRWRPSCRSSQPHCQSSQPH